MAAKMGSWRRGGAVIPLVALSLVFLTGLVGFAIDLGTIMVAKTQAQNAADVAAMAGARTLNASSGGNTGQATTNAKYAAAANTVLGQVLADTEVTITHGAYHYDAANKAFIPVFPPGVGDNYGLTQATVTPKRTTSGFANIFGMPTYDVAAVSIAAHRPRDVSLILDYSGSMNNESDLWVVEAEYGSSNYNTSNNADTTYPQWGPYNPSFSPLAAMRTTSTDPRVGRCNISASALGVPAQVGDYFQNARGASALAAFSPAPASVTNSAPGGDTYLTKKNSTTTALVWSEITDGASTSTPSTNFATAVGGKVGYNAYYTGGRTFQGWTQGPGYWGKTFFIWPPDPNTPNDSASPPVPGDWRKRFFFLSDGTTPLNDNRKLFNASGGLNDPPGNYVINYKAILAWIRANCVQASSSDGKPFPPLLRAARIIFYDAVPTDVPGSPTDMSASSAYNHANKNPNIPWADSNQRFWKEYIDFTLGVWRDPYGNIQHPPRPSCSMGGDFTAGTSTGGQYVQITGPDRSVQGKTFIDPQDNPKRPRHTFWFGPMTMIQYLLDTGLLPGTAKDISMYTAKLGIQGALNDIQNNHPNDLVSLLMYSRPIINTASSSGGADPPGVAQFSMAQVGLTNDFTKLMDALYFPPNTGTADARIFDANDIQTPRAHGDYCGNTATGYGFMLAYNQYSGASYSSGEGGKGRVGASKLAILETDGMANVAVKANFTKATSGSGASTVNNSYWQIASTDSISLDNPAPQFGAPSSTSAGGQHALNMAARLCALTSDNTNGPGFATPSKPVIIHCIAFGAVLEPVTSPPSQQAAVMTLCQQLSTIGGTNFPSSVNDTSSPDYYKLVIGDQASRQNKMTAAFRTIMDSDVPVSLVK